MNKPLLVSDELTNADLYWSGMDECFWKIVTTEEAERYLGYCDIWFEKNLDKYPEDIRLHILGVQSQHIRGRMFYGESLGDCGSCKGKTEAYFSDERQRFITKCRLCGAEGPDMSDYEISLRMTQKYELDIIKEGGEY